MINIINARTIIRLRSRFIVRVGFNLFFIIFGNPFGHKHFAQTEDIARGGPKKPLVFGWNLEFEAARISGTGWGDLLAIIYGDSKLLAKKFPHPGRISQSGGAFEDESCIICVDGV